MEKQNRNSYIDIVKGLGMVLVILGHLNVIPQISRAIIYSFHMPLFFILSGLFLKNYSNFKECFSKTFKTLYVPFLSVVLFDTIIITIFGIIEGTGIPYLEIKNNIFVLFGFCFDLINRPVWFLFALFIIKNIYYFCRKKTYLKVACIVVSFVTVIVLYKRDIPSGIIYVMAFAEIGFFALGDILRDFVFDIPKIVKNNTRISALLLLLSIPILAYFSCINECVDITDYICGNPILFYFNGIFGSLVFFVFCALIYMLKDSRLSLVINPIEALGRNTIFVLVSHYYLCRKIYCIIYIILGIEQYLYLPLNEVFLLIITLLLMIPVIYLSNKYFYFIFGRKKKEKVINKT